MKTKYNPGDIILADFHIDKDILMVLSILVKDNCYKYKFLVLSEKGRISYDPVESVDHTWKTELLA